MWAMAFEWRPNACALQYTALRRFSPRDDRRIERAARELYRLILIYVVKAACECTHSWLYSNGQYHCPSNIIINQNLEDLGLRNIADSFITMKLVEFTS